MPGHAQQHFAMSCAKMAEPIDLPFGLWTQNSYSLGGANVTSWEETWARPGEYD